MIGENLQARIFCLAKISLRFEGLKVLQIELEVLQKSKSYLQEVVPVVPVLPDVQVHQPVKQATCEFDPWVRKTPWRRKWQPTPVVLPGKFHGQRSLVGYSPWGREESDMTECKHTRVKRHSSTQNSCTKNVKGTSLRGKEKATK